jgi:hypothetical protein
MRIRRLIRRLLGMRAAPPLTNEEIAAKWRCPTGAVAVAREEGRREGAIAFAEKLRKVMDVYRTDYREVSFRDAVDQLLAVVNNELADMAGDNVTSEG